MANIDSDAAFLVKLQTEFYAESQDLIEDCEAVLHNMSPQNWDDFKPIFLANVHTLKGSARAAEFETLSHVLHFVEDTGNDLSDQPYIDVNLKLMSAISTTIEALKNGQTDKADVFMKRILSTRNEQ